MVATRRGRISCGSIPADEVDRGGSSEASWLTLQLNSAEIVKPSNSGYLKSWCNQSCVKEREVRNLHTLIELPCKGGPSET